MLKAKKAENNKIIKSGFLGFCRGKYEASGCFIGGEVGLGFGESYLNPTTATATTKKLTMPAVNLFFGYQWYYKQNQALKVRAHIGYGYYPNGDMTLEPNMENPFFYKFNTHAIQYGAELAWIWDFLRKGKHTLGLELSALGFEGSTFFSSSQTLIDPNNEPNATSQTTAFRFVGNITSVVWTSRIGLHYYFNVNHQVSLSYAYKGYSINSAKMYNEIDGQIDKELGYEATLSSTARNQIYLGYAYKF